MNEMALGNNKFVLDQEIQSNNKLAAENERLRAALDWCKAITDWTELHRHVNAALAVPKGDE